MTSDQVRAVLHSSAWKSLQSLTTWFDCSKLLDNLKLIIQPIKSAQKYLIVQSTPQPQSFYCLIYFSNSVCTISKILKKQLEEICITYDLKRRRFCRGNFKQFFINSNPPELARFLVYLPFSILQILSIHYHILPKKREENLNRKINIGQ